MEGLNNLEYLLGWFSEHKGELAAPSYRRLRQATEQQLVAARGQLVPRLVPVPPSPRPCPNGPLTVRRNAPMRKRSRSLSNKRSTRWCS